MRRILKPTGSIYLHCDPTMSHYLKLVMDAIFGRKNYRNEIVWNYSGWNKRLKSYIERRHDLILFYAMSDKQIFNYPTRPWSGKDEYIKVRKQKLHIDKTGREYVLSDAGGGKRAKRFLDDAMAYGVPLDDVWTIDKINNSDIERTGYPTQKPLALLKRIIEISSNEGDVVLDPFCGCATTCVMADTLNRPWARDRHIPKSRGAGASNGSMTYTRAIIHRIDIPKRTDLGKIPNYRDPANRKMPLRRTGGALCWL